MAVNRLFTFLRIRGPGIYLDFTLQRSGQLFFSSVDAPASIVSVFGSAHGCFTECGIAAGVQVCQLCSRNLL